jgi:hypothetical protein
MKKIDFKREHFIKDLFIPERIINSFNSVEFESYDTFSYCIANDLYLVEEDSFLFVPIKKITDYLNMVKMFEQTNICERSNVYLVIRDQDLLDKVFSTISDKKYSILISEDLKVNIGKYWNTPRGKAWISKNKLVKETRIDAEKYNEQLNGMICTFNEESIRFFLLDFDYKSFEGMKFEELHKLRFWINNLKIWMKLKDSNSIEVISSSFVKKIFVSDDLTLYMNRKKERDVWFFELGKYIHHDGQAIPVKVLNLLRQYSDLIANAVYSDFKISNWFIIDYANCKEIQGSLNEIPLIMGLINRWLYDF